MMNMGPSDPGMKAVEIRFGQEVAEYLKNAPYRALCFIELYLPDDPETGSLYVRDAKAFVDRCRRDKDFALDQAAKAVRDGLWAPPDLETIRVKRSLGEWKRQGIDPLSFEEYEAAREKRIRENLENSIETRAQVSSRSGPTDGKRPAPDPPLPKEPEL